LFADALWQQVRLHCPANMSVVVRPALSDVNVGPCVGGMCGETKKTSWLRNKNQPSCFVSSVHKIHMQRLNSKSILVLLSTLTFPCLCTNCLEFPRWCHSWVTNLLGI